MCRSWCDRFVKIIVYQVITLNILLPMILLVFDDRSSCISTSDILTSIVWIISGVLLLLGTLQGKEKYVRVYVMLTTVCLLLGPFFMALFPGDGLFCERKNTFSMLTLLVYFIIMWPFQYIVYLYYRQLAKGPMFVPVREEEV